MRQRPRRRRGVSDSRVSVPIRYGSLSSPIGRIWLAFTDRGLRRVALGGPTEQEFLVDLLRLEPAGRPVRDERAAEIAAARAELREYFAGRRRHFSLRVDRRRLTAFQERVLACTADIPHGCVASYSAVAAAIARPGAARAVGGALGRNPVPIVIPCHRVIAADGSLGGFSVRGTRRSLGIKSRLLAIEQGRASGR